MLNIAKDRIYLVCCREVLKNSYGKAQHIVVCTDDKERIEGLMQANMPDLQFITATPLTQFEDVVQRIVGALQGNDPEWKVIHDSLLA